MSRACPSGMLARPRQGGHRISDPSTRLHATCFSWRPTTHRRWNPADGGRVLPATGRQDRQEITHVPRRRAGAVRRDRRPRPQEVVLRPVPDRGAGRLDVPVIGVALSDWTTTRFREHAQAAVHASDDGHGCRVVDRLGARLSLVSGDYSDAATFQELARRLREGDVRSPVVYLAIPPSLFPTVIAGLASVGLHDTVAGGRREAVRPRPRVRAGGSTPVLHEHFDERAIFRIDHYLGKESVEDLLVFRFANTLPRADLEPQLRRQRAGHDGRDVRGRGARARSTTSVGAMRDVVQNHLLQVVALLAMEPPVGPDADACGTRRSRSCGRCARSTRPTLVRGQYDGYLDEPGVAPDSDRRDVRRLRLEIDSWRWSGVPFYVRAGKGLDDRRRSRQWSSCRSRRGCCSPTPARRGRTPNLIRFRLGPHDGVTVTVQAKTPGPGARDPGDRSRRRLRRTPRRPAGGLRAAAGRRPRGQPPPVRPPGRGRERLARRAARPDEPGPIHTYERGSWGPAEADDLLGGDHWHAPLDGAVDSTIEAR